MLTLRRPSGSTTSSHGGVALLVPRRRPRDARRQSLFEGRGWVAVRLATDLGTSLLACLIALISVGEGEGGLAGVQHTTLFALPLLVTVMLYLRRLYGSQMSTAVLDELAPVAGAVSVAAMTLLAVGVAIDGDASIATVLGRAWLLAIAMVSSGRGVLLAAQRRARAARKVGRRTLIVGAGEIGAQLARRLHEHPEYGLRPIGFLDADPSPGISSEQRQLPILGPPEQLARVAAEAGAEHVIFAFTAAPDRTLISVARRCDELGLEASIVPRFFESINDRLVLERLGGLPLLGLRWIDPKGWQFRLKYGMDRPIAALVLVLAAPVLALAALAVALTSPGPVLFRQRRVGRDGQVFNLLKLRSMRMPGDATEFRPPAGRAPGGVEGDDRRTVVGRILRRLAIDELPQLINVLKGEMSLVGPRPERPEFAELFGRDLARYDDRHRVKSGLTGWAQVHGLRGQTSLADRIEWDNYYIENWSLWLDVKILLLTLGAVLRSGEDA